MEAKAARSGVLPELLRALRQDSGGWQDEQWR